MSRLPLGFIFIPALLCSCATTYSENQFTALVHTGRIVDRLFLPGAPNVTVSVPLFVGKGVLHVGTPFQNRFGTPGFYVYDVESKTGKRVRVADRGDIQTGTCVDVLLKPGTPSNDSVPPGDGVLVASEKC